mgnify:CR=1 FL=1|jgi:hypothetical protein
MVKKKRARKSKKSLKSRFAKKFDQKRFIQSLRNLIVYAVLALIFYWLSGVFLSEFSIYLFWALAIICGLVAMAFLILVLVFIFLRWFMK